MEASEEERKLELVSRCSDLYSGPYRAAKRQYIVNNGELNRTDIRTQENLLDVLESTDNFFTSLDNGDLDEAENRLSRLRNQVEKTACEAAAFRPEHKISKLENRRFPTYWPYRILLFSEVPRLEHHRDEVRRVHQLMEDADEMSVNRWEDCLEKYDRSNDILDRLLTNTPERSSVYLRIFVILTGIATIAGLVITENTGGL